jgi:hypothetical protein
LAPDFSKLPREGADFSFGRADTLTLLRWLACAATNLRLVVSPLLYQPSYLTSHFKHFRHGPASRPMTVVR